MNLLFVVVLTVITFAVQIDLSREQEASDIHAIAFQCKVETGAKDEDVANFLNHELSTSMNGMCLRACIIKKTDIMDANGKLFKDLSKKFKKNVLDNKKLLPIATEILDICVNLNVSDNHCEAAEQYWSCLKTECGKRKISTSAFTL